MNLSEYEAKITEIEKSDLTAGEKQLSLEMLADEIDGCAWQYPARSRAKEVSGAARIASGKYPNTGLSAMDGLASKGLLRKK
jgi:hypothetical protein